MKKILYISYDGITDPLGQSQVLPYLKGLAARGHQVIILSLEKPGAFSALRINIEKEIQHSNIEWKPLLYKNQYPVISAMQNAQLMRKTAKDIAKSQNIDIAHCRGYLPAITGLKLKNKYDVKLLFDMRGFWADERVEGGIWNRNNPLFALIYRYFKWQEKRLFKSADAIVSLTEAGKNIINGWPYMNRNTEQISVIPCCADFNRFSRKDIDNKKVTEWRHQLAIQDTDFILSYLGSIGSWYMLPEMLDFFAVLLEFKPHAKMLFITNDDENNIKTLAAQKEIEPGKIICKGVPQKEVPHLISLSDLSIFFIRPVFSKQASSPTKLAEILAMGIPAITNKGVGDVDSLFAEHFPHLLVNGFEKKHYRTCLNKYFKQTQLPPDKLREIAMENFSLTDGVEQYHKIYTQI